MIGDKPYYLPINQYVAWKVTKNEESEAVNKEEIEYKVNYRLFKLRTKEAKNGYRDKKLFQKIMKQSKKDIIPMIEAKNKDDDWLMEERSNIARVTSAKNEQDRVGPLLLPEDG